VTARTYYTSWPRLLTAFKVRRELDRHGVTFSDFMAVHGSHNTYPSAALLAWLGY
jgi:hypothetical protein